MTTGQTRYELEDYVDDLRRITREEGDHTNIIERVKPLAQRLAENRDWIDKEKVVFNEMQGFGIHMLHEEPNHDLAVFLFSWLPGEARCPATTTRGR